MSSNLEVFVLHQYGAPSHYEGLRHYCREKNVYLYFRELAFGSQLLSGLKNLDISQIKKSFVNVGFLFSLLFSKNRIIVLGVAPSDYRFIFINFIAGRHKFFYHTSWPYWDGSYFPKVSSFNKIVYPFLKRKIDQSRRFFLEEKCKGIFCVSGFTREQITTYYRINVPVQTVYHSIDDRVFFADKSGGRRDSSGILRLLFVGRLVPPKGIDEIIDLAKSDIGGHLRIAIVGYGVMEQEVKKASSDVSNIDFLGRKERWELGEIYRDYDILLCPSKRGYGVWEELFGISIIEGMSCGLIPIATDHKGPKEIITHMTDGILLRDSNLTNDLHNYIRFVLEMSEPDIVSMKRASELRAKDFYVQQIALRWRDIMYTYLEEN